jgi:hypothetical protein
MEAREQRNRDACIPIARGDVFVERIGHARHLDGAGEPCDRTARDERSCRYPIDVDPPGNSCRVRVRADRPYPKASRSEPNHEPGTTGGEERDDEAQVKSRPRYDPRQPSRRIDRDRLWVDVQRFLQWASDEIPNPIQRDKVE